MTVHVAGCLTGIIQKRKERNDTNSLFHHSCTPSIFFPICYWGEEGKKVKGKEKRMERKKHQDSGVAFCNK